MGSFVQFTQKKKKKKQDNEVERLFSWHTTMNSHMWVRMKKKENKRKPSNSWNPKRQRTWSLAVSKISTSTWNPVTCVEEQ